MSLQLGKIFNFFVSVEKQERLKVLLLTFCFFFVIGGYTIAKELKDAVFTSIVGHTYVAKAKIISMILLIPGILLYSKLVDLLRRHQLLYFYSLLYGLIGFIFVYFLGHSTIGLANTQASPYRMLGWVFYFFMEGYSPFVVSVFWSYANSINSPKSAQNNYALMIAGSKVGGMLSAGFAWWIVTCKTDFCGFELTDVVSHQLLLSYSSLCLLLVPFVVYLLNKKVSSKSLHGYEAAYQVDKQEEKQLETHMPTHHKIFSSIQRMFSGLSMLFKYPYLLGIFAMIFFYEIVNVILQIKRLEIFQSSSETISDLSGSLYEQIFIVHCIGLVIALVGTRTLMKVFGERVCLLLVPLLTGIFILYFLVDGSRNAVLWALVLLRAVNYAFSSPLRESLYIPTVKEIKFKSKSWIEAFGGKFSKTFGALYKDWSLQFAGATLSVDALFFGTLVTLWVITAYLLGNKYEKAIKNNEVIGAERV